MDVGHEVKATPHPASAQVGGQEETAARRRSKTAGRRPSVGASRKAAAMDADATRETPATIDVQREWDRRFLDAGGHPWGQAANATVQQAVADLPPGDALDLGAGDGRNTRWLAQRGWRVTAVDISEVALEQLRESAWGQGWELTTIHADLRVWRPPGEMFDLVLLSFVQLAQPHRGPLHEDAARALRPGGTLVLVAHDRSNLDGGVGGPQDPAKLPTADEVRAELPGLTIERAEIIERPVEGAPRPARDLVVVATRPA